MKKYKGIIYIIPILILCVILSSCSSKKTQYTSKNENTQERINTNNLTYYEIMKAPYYYQGENVNFKGRLVEVFKKDNNIMIKLAVNSKLDNMLIVCGKNIEQSKDVNDNNIINISGSFTGLIKYRAISGEEVTIPGVWMNSMNIIK